MRFPAAIVLLLVGPLAGAAEHVVSIGPGFNYNPEEIEVEAGDTVLFSASGTHPLRSDDQIFGCNEDCVVSFNTPGTYPFFCQNHGDPGGQGMSGRIVVVVSPRIHADGFEDAAF